MRTTSTSRGFTLIEIAVVLAIAAVLGGLVIWQGRAARQAADIAGGAFDLALRMGALKARAVADAREYLLVVVDASNPDACVRSSQACGRLAVLRSPTPAFSLGTFDPDGTVANAELIEVERLPTNTRFDLASTWRPPPPFNAVTTFDPAVRTTCAGGRACFAIRYRANGDVTALFPGATATLPGFAFVLAPVEQPSRAAERRGLFVSFPAGLVKTAAFSY